MRILSCCFATEKFDSQRARGFALWYPDSHSLPDACTVLRSKQSPGAKPASALNITTELLLLARCGALQDLSYNACRDVVVPFLPQTSDNGGPVKKSLLGAALFGSLLLAAFGQDQTFDLITQPSKEDQKKQHPEKKGNKQL